MAFFNIDNHKTIIDNRLVTLRAVSLDVIFKKLDPISAIFTFYLKNMHHIPIIGYHFLCTFS